MPVESQREPERLGGDASRFDWADARSADASGAILWQCVPYFDLTSRDLRTVAIRFDAGYDSCT